MKLILKDKKQEATDTYSFIFEIPKNFNWKAGQFLRYHLEAPNPDERGNDRFFTIAAALFEKVAMITTRFATGDGSSFKKNLFNMKVGEGIEAMGPMGKFIIDDPDKKNIFIAGGIGVTPYRAMLLDLDHQDQQINVDLLYSNRTPEFVFKDELESLQSKHQNFQIHYFVSPQRIDEKVITEKVPDLQKPIFFVSGPEPMVQATVGILQKLQVPDDHIKRDYFPGYNWPEDGRR